MSILSASRPASKPIRRRETPTVEQIIASTPVAPATLDPWTDRPVHDVDKADLTFGVRVRHHVIPGTWRVVREAQRMDACRSFRVRVRELADNGSLIGPVLSWNVAEVAALVSDEPTAPVEDRKCDQITLTAEPAPLVVAMVLSINGQHYAVAPLAPSPAAVKAYRFIRADETASYDLDETATGASCSCPDFIWRREGLDPSGCKHVKAARMLGLFAESTAAPVVRQVEPAPCCEPSEPVACEACATVHTPLPGDDASERTWDPTIGAEEDEPPRYGPQDDGGGGWDAYDDDRWAISETAPESDPEVLQLIADGAFEQAEGEGPLGYASPECFAAVGEGRADWAREFGWVPCPGWVTPENRADLLADDAIDGGWASRPRGYFEGLIAAAFVECPPTAEDPDPRPLADRVDIEARHYRTLGTPFGDLMAETIAELAARVRAVDAMDVETFRDREDGVLSAL